MCSRSNVQLRFKPRRELTAWEFFLRDWRLYCAEIAFGVGVLGLAATMIYRLAHR